MKKSHTNSSSEAFTLIELLVVIAIIGILAGLLFPAIQGALVNANALKVGNNGKSIVQAIIAANTERESMNMGSVWPNKSSNFADGQNAKDYTTGESEIYFFDLIDSKTIDNIGWFVFAGGGVGAATDSTQFNNGNCNVWNYIGALDEGATDDTPFLFTRNFEIATGDLTTFSNAQGFDNENKLGQKLNANIKPFGNQLVVTISKGGAYNNIKHKFMKNPTLFFGSSTFGASSESSESGAASAQNKNATVVVAKGTGSSN